MTKLLKIPEAAAELAISRSLLYELIAAGEIRSVTVGTRGVRIPASEIDRFVTDRIDRGRRDAAA